MLYIDKLVKELKSQGITVDVPHTKAKTNNQIYRASVPTIYKHKKHKRITQKKS